MEFPSRVTKMNDNSRKEKTPCVGICQTAMKGQACIKKCVLGRKRYLHNRRQCYEPHGNINGLLHGRFMYGFFFFVFPQAINQQTWAKYLSRGDPKGILLYANKKKNP
jgi:hypothetical protein